MFKKVFAKNPYSDPEETTRRLNGLPTKNQELLNRLEALEGKKSKSSKNKSSLPKQLLILYYMGMLNSFDLSNLKNAKLLSVLLNGDEQNIRTSLSDFIDNQLRSSSALTHLEEIASLFTDLGLQEPLQKVKNDIVKLKIKK